MRDRYLGAKSPPVEGAGDMARSGAWIESELRDGAGYRFAAGCPRTLLATSIGVLALEHYGELPQLSEARRQALGDAIMRAQHEDSGLFRDPLHDDARLFRLGKFTPLYVEWQETYFALHALDALEREPAHALRFVAPFRERRALDAWLRTLRFDDFWFASNYLMFLLLFLIRVEAESAETAHRVLDVMDARQDPETGFWGTQQGASLFNGMAGAYHLYGYYQYFGRPIAHQEVAIRSTLRCQEDTGLFGGRGGGPCEDLDAIDILAKLKPASGAQDLEVREALHKALPALRSCRHRSGAYQWLAPLPEVKQQTICYSGLETLTAPSDGGDVWSAWFRPLAIALACERLGEPVSWPVRYRSQPLLGWHDPDKGSAARRSGA